MSFAPPPDSNPYAAPATQLGGLATARSFAYTGYAGFWRRFAAYLLDALVVLTVVIGVPFTIGIVIGVSDAMSGRRTTQADFAFGNDADRAVGLAVYAFLFVTTLAYSSLMESSPSQATLGKLAMGLKVVDLHGRRISLGHAVGRALARIFLSELLFKLGFLMAAFTDRRQALHDLVAGTLVVKTR